MSGGMLRGLLDALSGIGPTGQRADVEDLGKTKPVTMQGMVNMGTRIPAQAGILVDALAMALQGSGATDLPLDKFVGSTDWIQDKLGGDPKASESILSDFVSPDPTDLMRAAKFAPELAMTLFHGSPHKWDRVDLSRVGTGEGAQAFGHGFYVAENPGVANSYKYINARIDPSVVTYNGKTVDEMYSAASRKQDRAHRLKDEKAIRAANAELKFWEDLAVRNHPDQVISDAMADPGDWPELTDYVRSIDKSKFSGVEPAGNIYELDVPDEAIEKMLDWDKPLSEQPESVRKALSDMIDPETGKMYEGADLGGSAGGNLTGGGGADIYRTLARQWDNGYGPDELISITAKNGQEAASKYLDALGVPGIKYLDGASRKTGEGSRNFVIFNEKNVTPLKRNGELLNAISVDK